jgi:release factor glutamine methyltransferase
VSLLLFNPPYVPTPDEEVGSTQQLAAAWAGGTDGRRVVDRAVPQIAALLERSSGTCLLVTVDDNRPAQLAREFGRRGMQMRPFLRRRARNEFLTVQRITWIDGGKHSQE